MLLPLPTLARIEVDYINMLLFTGHSFQDHKNSTHISKGSVDWVNLSIVLESGIRMLCPPRTKGNSKGGGSIRRGFAFYTIVQGYNRQHSVRLTTIYGEFNKGCPLKAKAQNSKT